MRRLNSLMILAVGVFAGAIGFYWLEHRSEPIGTPAVAEQSPAQKEGPKILYYRNPMGLPDTSPVPKKDWMGMDYIPVYEGEEQDDGKTVKVSLDKVQRSGVRTEIVEARPIVRPVRAIGTVTVDERRLTVVALRSDGFVEDLFVNATGQDVRAGEPLFRVYSPAIVSAQVDFQVAMGHDAGAQRLRNLGVHESFIRDLRGAKAIPRTIDWPATSSIGSRTCRRCGSLPTSRKATWPRSRSGCAQASRSAPIPRSRSKAR